MSQANRAEHPVIQKHNGQEFALPNTSNGQEQTPTLPEVLRDLSETLRALQPSLEEASRLEAINGYLEISRTVFLNGVFFLFLIVTGSLMIREVRKNPIIIEPIAVPESLTKQGYTSNIVSVRIMDEFREIEKQTKTSQENGDLTPEWSEGDPKKSGSEFKIEADNLTPQWSEGDLEVPGTSFNIETSARFLRNILNFPVRRIQGEITKTSDDLFKVQLRVSGLPSGPQVISPDDEAQIDDLIHQAALKLLGVIDPYTLALHLYNQNDYAGAKTIVGQMLQTLPKDDDPSAYILWGRMLKEKDPAAAIKMYQRAIEIKPNFYTVYAHWGAALEAKEDLTGAVEIYRKGAELGDPWSQLKLGLMYENGKGVDQDDEEAARLYRLAAEQGEALGYNNLALMYEDGKGVDQDYEEAARLYRLAAKQGDALGQTYLGVMYEDGKGVEQDYEEAARLYRLAAEQGNVEAQANLAEMYKEGRGVPKDLDEAKRWPLKSEN